MALAGCGILLTGLAIPAAAQEQAADYRKIENVYARLSPEGSQSSLEVVNHFEVASGGTVTDYGPYSRITNLSTTDPLTLGDGFVHFAAEPGNFYYQGHLDQAELPWVFRITYQLDGKDIQPTDLGGKTGALKIRFRCSGRPTASDVFLDNYVMQISLTLDNDLCSEITAPDAAIADAGDGTQLTFTLLPGMDADYTVEARVHDFTMSGFSIAAVPYSISIDTDAFESDDFSDQMDELTDGAGKLKSGAWDLVNGIRDLESGGASVVNGSSDIKSGLKSLSTNAYKLADSAKGISTSLSAISAGLSEGDFSGLAELSKLPEGLTQMADTLDGLCSGMVGLRSGFEASYTALQTAVQQSTAAAPTQEELNALQNACGSNPLAASGLQKLLMSYQHLQTLLKTWSNVQSGFQAVLTQLDPSGEQSILYGIQSVSKGLRQMAEAFSDGTEGSGESQDIGAQLASLCQGITALSAGLDQFYKGLYSYADGVKEMSSNYGSFHSGLASFSDGVGKLADGAADLADGVGEFTDGVCEIPDKIQESIDDMLNQMGGDFEAVSFLDSRNRQTASVQFVLSTDGIELPEVVTVEPAEQAPTFWDRLAALFQ